MATSAWNILPKGLPTVDKYGRPIPQLNLPGQEVDPRLLASQAPPSPSQINPTNQAAVDALQPPSMDDTTFNASFLKPKVVVPPRGPSQVPQESDLYNRLLALTQGAADKSQKTADDYAGQPLQTDYSPLMALADSWSGSKLAAGYKAPESANQRMVNVAALQDKAGDNQANVAKLQLSRLLGGEKNDTAMFLRALAGDRASTKQDQFTDRMSKQAADNLNNHWMIKRLGEQGMGLDSVNGLIDLARKGNTTAFSSVGPKMAKAMGEVGVLTENDVKRYVQSKQLSRSTGDKWSNWVAGHPSEMTMDEIQEITRVLKGGMDSKINPIYKNATLQLAHNMHMAPEEAAYRLNVDWNQIKDAGKNSAAAPAPTLTRPKEMPEEQWNVLSPTGKQAIVDRYKK